MIQWNETNIGREGMTDVILTTSHAHHANRARAESKKRSAFYCTPESIRIERLPPTSCENARERSYVTLKGKAYM